MTSLSQEALLVRAALEAEGLETPLVANELNGQQKKEKIEGHMRAIMETLGLDLADDSLAETPHRIAKMYVNEIFSGLDYATFPKVTVIENKMKVDEMIMVRDISLTSTCEHHFVTIDGLAHVAYIPRGKVIGLSKINRIVQFFARRPQVQERLTTQVADAMETVLRPRGTLVLLEAEHLCMGMRGVRKPGSSTVTSAVRGIFRNDVAARAEAMRLVGARH